MTGIIGAMKIEVESIAASMTYKRERIISGISFISGRLYGQSVVLARCGIGKVSAAVCAQILISVYKVDSIINTGVAGGLAAELRQGDIVVASGFVEHDMDTSPIGDPVGWLSGLDTIQLPCGEELADRLYKIASANDNYATLRGIIASGDQFVASAERAEFIRSTFGAAACEMEGAAIAHACFMAKIPFAAVRCISDNADGEAGMSYADFSAIAADRCAKLVLDTFAEAAE